jgi:hypothetical protein
VILNLTIHDSWAAHPGPLSRLLAHLAALEAPAPWTPPAVREPGQDDDDLAELLAGMDDTPEPAPRPAPPAAPPAVPKPPAAASFDGTPRTGKSLYRWACDHKALPKVNAIGKLHAYPKLVSDWEPSQVAAAYAILTAEPVANGRPH